MPRPAPHRSPRGHALTSHAIGRHWGGIAASLRGLLELVAPLAERRGAVHGRAMGKGALARGNVFRFTAPGLERSRLQGSPVREGELPGERTHLVHERKVGGGVLVRLAAR